MDIIEKFHERIDLYLKLKEKISEELKQEFEPFVEALLKKHKAECLSVQAFMPSYCDGDPCTYHFCVNEDTYDHVSRLFDDEGDLSNLDNADEDAIDEVTKVISGMEDILRTTFGESFEVVAAFDADGKFHYHLDTDYDCGY